VLIDTGKPGFAEEVRAASEASYGHTPPAAIILTHGHAEQSGNAQQLATYWRVRIYAHRLELPYLKGISAYPPQDPLVGGFFGLVSAFAPPDLQVLDYPIYPLPDHLPILPEWRIIHTPGHTPGHVALFREEDCTLLSGDALSTVNLENLHDLLTQTPTIAAGPVSFISDWQAFIQSVHNLAALRPKILAPAHGKPMEHRELASKLNNFAKQISPPDFGRYALEPALTDENGIVSLPPKIPFAWAHLAWHGLTTTGAGIGALLAAGWFLLRRKKAQNRQL
jgi:glyoxylase-like metal-dependent hydrolase (beta-lactamase superfamily II)